jgi:hypothetical protein
MTNEITLWHQIIAVYPELEANQNAFLDGTISLQNDSDGLGDYIRVWNYSQPIPEGLTLGKPSA